MITGSFSKMLKLAIALGFLAVNGANTGLSAGDKRVENRFQTPIRSIANA